MENIRDWVMAQALCDSLTSRTCGMVYAIFNEYGRIKCVRACRIYGNVDVIADAGTYGELVEQITDYLLEVIENEQ